MLVVIPPGTAAADHRNETHLSGVLPRLAIDCRFADLADVTPVGDEKMRALMGDGRSGITAWWQEVSYGAIEPTGEWLGWIGMDARTRDYLRGGLFILEGRLGTFTAPVQDCAGKAAELTDLGQYDSPDLFFNTARDAWFGSRYELTLGGITRS